jgi:hypothetical protein
MVKLLPRLEKHEVKQVVSCLVDNDVHPNEAMGAVGSLNLAPHWNRAGGIKATPEERQEFAETLRQTARKTGFPNQRNISGQQEFDRAAARILHASQLLKDSGSEVFREECWAGLVGLDMPDVARWRFGPVEERFRGGVRNLLQRIWLRTRSLRLNEKKFEDPWLLVDSLTEDAFLQLIERPSISSDPRLSRMIGFVWSKHSRNHRNMQQILRDATKLLRARSEIRFLSGLSDRELAEEVKEAFEKAVELDGATSQ